IENADKFGARDSGFFGEISHRQLVAKAAEARAVHAGELEVFAGQSRSNYIEFVQPNDTVNPPRTGDLRNYPNIINQQSVILYRFDFVDRRRRPGLIEQLFSRDKRDAPAGILGLFEKLVALMLAGDANDVVFHHGFYFASKEWHNLLVKTKKQRVNL